MKFKKLIGKILQKIGLKEIGTQIDLKVNSIYRDHISYLRKLYIPKIVKYRSQNGILALKLDSDWLGLGARIVTTIELLMYAEENEIQLQIEYGYKKRKDNHSYFGDLFELKNIGEAKNLATNIRHISELKLSKDYNNLLNIQQANCLFHKYIEIKKSILNEVEMFINDKFSGNVLGLHYRGTDKIGEAPKVDLDFVYNVILKTLNSSDINYTKLFISSDETNCIDYFVKSNLPVEIIWRDDIYRSTDGKQVHRETSNDMTIINREALINCLILSRCDLLIKTASILSDICKIFNPQLNMIILNEPHNSSLTWWPASELNLKYRYNLD